MRGPTSGGGARKRRHDSSSRRWCLWQSTDGRIGAQFGQRSGLYFLYDCSNLGPNLCGSFVSLFGDRVKLGTKGGGDGFSGFWNLAHAGGIACIDLLGHALNDPLGKEFVEFTRQLGFQLDFLFAKLLSRDDHGGSDSDVAANFVCE
jgi:hypothetical protein